MRSEIAQVVNEIWERYSEDLSLQQLAKTAMLSPYHMARVFRQETGLPPARFLGTVRMEKAKRRLLTTDDRISEISAEVGYASLGTFTTRFTEIIGLSPGQYRQLGLLPDYLGKATQTGSAPFRYGSIVGHIERSDGITQAPVFIAAFPAAATNAFGHPCLVTPRPGAWRIDQVPEGLWVVRAASPGHGACYECDTLAGTGPVQVQVGSAAHVNLVLRPSETREMPTDEYYAMASKLLSLVRGL